MRRVRAALLRFAVFAGYFLHRAGEPLKVTQDYPVQRHFAHGAPGEHGGTGSTAGAEEGAGGESGMLDVFLCLYAVRSGEAEEEQPAKVRNARISYQLASLVFVLISMDNLLRWLEQSYWFWLCSGRMAMVVLFGALALGAQFLYWAEIVRRLNDHLDEG